MAIYIIRRFGQSILFIALAWLLIYTGLVFGMPKGPGAAYYRAISGYQRLVQQSGEEYAKANYIIDPETKVLEQRYKFDKPWPLNFLLWLFDPSDTTQANSSFETVPKGIDVSILGLQIKGAGILTGDFGKSEHVFKGREISEGIGCAGYLGNPCLEPAATGHNALGVLLRSSAFIANPVPRKVQSPYYVLEPLSEGDMHSLVRALLHLLQFHTSSYQMAMCLDVEEANQ